MRKRKWLSVAVVLLQVGWSAPTFAADYYPLHTGDAWYLNAIPWHIGNEATLDSRDYFELRYRELLWCHVRRDDTGKVFRKMTDRPDELYYDLEADVGDNWLYRESDYLHYKVTLESKSDTVRTGFGEFTDCYRYSFISVPVTLENGTIVTVTDANYAEVLAPDIGLVKQMSLDWYTESTLLKAFVDGRKIPPELLPLTVIWTYPDNAETGVSVNTEIKAFFPFGPRPISFNSEPFTVVSSKKGIISGEFNVSSCLTDGSITFHPDNPLPSDDTIQVTVKAGIKDFVGDTLAEQYNFSFVTDTLAAVCNQNTVQFSIHTCPNPFNPSTTIAFTIPDAGKATLTIYDISGRVVRKLLSGNYTAGEHSVVWDGRDESGMRVSSGVYLSRLQSGGQVATGKMLLIK